VAWLPGTWSPAAVVAAKLGLLLALPVLLLSCGFLDPAEKGKIKNVLADLGRRRSR
jgi:hypothetical protein